MRRLYKHAVRSAQRRARAWAPQLQPGKRCKQPSAQFVSYIAGGRPDRFSPTFWQEAKHPRPCIGGTRPSGEDARGLYAYAACPERLSGKKRRRGTTDRCIWNIYIRSGARQAAIDAARKRARNFVAPCTRGRGEGEACTVWRSPPPRPGKEGARGVLDSGARCSGECCRERSACPRCVGRQAVAYGTFASDPARGRR